MKALASLLLAVALIGTVPHSSLTIAENSTVVVTGNLQIVSHPAMLYPERSLNGFSYCSGVNIGRDVSNGDQIILTARHCVAETVEYYDDEARVVTPTPTRVHYFNGTYGVVKSVAFSATDDIGLIRVHTPREVTSVVFGPEVQRGDSYFAFGMPDGYQWSYADMVDMQGAMYSHAPKLWNETYAFACAACAPGLSGGGVFDNQGRLIGIVVAGDSSSTFVVPSVRIKQLLPDLLARLK